MTTMTAVAPLVITGCGVVSHAGIGLDALASHMTVAGSSAVGGSRADGLATIADEFPPTGLAAVPDLRAEEYLGKKGVRSLDRTTKLALVACNRALAGLSASLAHEDLARTGVVMGTSTGSIRSSSEFSRETLIREKPYLVRANLFPNSVMNCCASQIAIWNSMRGVNATIAGGRLSSLSAVRYARNAITQGHIERALVGGVEELCAQSAWAWYLSGALTRGVPIGEGAAVFVVETPAAAVAAGRAPLAELLACEVGSPGVSDVRQGLAARLAACIERALRRSGVSSAAITTISLSATGLRGLGTAEAEGVGAALGGGLPVRQIRMANLVGESLSASGALQIAGLLAAWRAAGNGSEGAALVTSVGNDGNVGCLVVRPPGAADVTG